MKPIQTIRARRRLPVKLTPISPVKIKKIERRKSSRDVIRRAVGTWIFRHLRKNAALKIEEVYIDYKQKQRKAVGVIEKFYLSKRENLADSTDSILSRRGMKLESLRLVEAALMNANDVPVPPPPSPITREEVFAFKESVPRSDRCTIC